MAQFLDRRRPNWPWSIFGGLFIGYRLESGTGRLRTDISGPRDRRGPDGRRSRDRFRAQKASAPHYELRFSHSWRFDPISLVQFTLRLHREFLIGFSGAFLAPALAAIALGIVGSGKLDRQFAKNQGFNSAGNVASALLRRRNGDCSGSWRGLEHCARWPFDSKIGIQCVVRRFDRYRNCASFIALVESS